MTDTKLIQEMMCMPNGNQGAMHAPQWSLCTGV